MHKWLFCSFACAIGLAHAQSQSSNKRELSNEFLNSTQALEQDELANSESRRDWLQNRLVISAGLGAKYGAWGGGDGSIYYGGAGEFISNWPGEGFGNVSVFGAYGFLPSKADPAFPTQMPQSASKDFRLGLGYTFLNKSPIHPGINLSWGQASYDFKSQLTAAEEATGKRPIVKASGYNIDATVSYLASDWYYFSLGVGVGITGKPGTTAKAGMDNSKSFSTATGSSNVVYSSQGIKQYTLPTFSFGVGIATPNLFPDEVEKRRLEREKARKKLGL